MRFIVDTNRIIAALIKDSISRKLIKDLEGSLVTIMPAIEEIEIHKAEILKKSSLETEEFDLLYAKTISRLVILSDKIVQLSMPEANPIMDNIDGDDTPFLAAAISQNAPIWSDDRHFQKQKKVKVYTTAELLKLVQKNKGF